MKLESKISKPIGILTKEIYDIETGGILEVKSEENVITNEGIAMMVNRIIGDHYFNDDTSSFTLKTIVLGDDDGGSGSKMAPTVATEATRFSDMNIVYTIPINDISFNRVDNATIEFSADLIGEDILALPQFNGMSYIAFCSQAMVFNSNPIISFSYKRFPETVLTSLIGVRVTWRYEFVECEE